MTPMWAAASTTSATYCAPSVDFPTCWDGQQNTKTGTGNTADYTTRNDDGVTDHLAYAGGTASNPTCPSGFTAGRLPYLGMAIQFLDRNGNDYRGDGTDIALASGAWSVGPDGIQAMLMTSPFQARRASTPSTATCSSRGFGTSLAARTTCRAWCSGASSW